MSFTTGRWQHTARCRACGHREPNRMRMETLCPRCGTGARYDWLLWAVLIERPVGLFRNRWEERGEDAEPWAPDHANDRGGYIQ